MSLESLTKRINRKLCIGCKILTEEDVLNLWDKATEVLSEEKIHLSQEASKSFKKKWIQCKAKQMIDKWPESVVIGGRELKLNHEDISKVGKEDEERLMEKLRLEVKFRKK